jgi:hypothetical protein
MSLLGHRQKFPKPKDMSAPPTKAEIGGVTDAQAEPRLPYTRSERQPNLSPARPVPAVCPTVQSGNLPCWPRLYRKTGLRPCTQPACLRNV